eukprot:scaffold70507_cov62-Attheya_sp.AAC.3
MTAQAYFKLFKNAVDVIEHSGGSAVGYAPGIEQDLATTREGIDVTTLGNADLVAEFKARGAQEEYLANIFALHTDKTRFGVYTKNLDQNQYLQGQGQQQQIMKMPQLAGNNGVSFAYVDGSTENVEETLSEVALATDRKARNNHYKAKAELHVTDGTRVQRRCNCSASPHRLHGVSFKEMNLSLIHCMLYQSDSPADNQPQLNNHMQQHGD